MAIYNLDNGNPANLKKEKQDLPCHYPSHFRPHSFGGRGNSGTNHNIRIKTHTELRKAQPVLVGFLWKKIIQKLMYQ
jgi:hypothetical protein